MNDRIIRTALKQYLSNKYSSNRNALILEELGLKHGRVIIDLVVINDSFHGYELKSNKDTLKRLPEQAEIFSSIFDHLTLIVGYRHAYKSIKIVPEWWGIKIAEKDPQGKVKFITLRRNKKNPSPDAFSIVHLLWRDEAISFLDEIDTANAVRSKPKKFIYEKIVEIADLDKIRARVRKQLRNRSNWRVDALQRLNDD